MAPPSTPSRPFLFSDASTSADDSRDADLLRVDWVTASDVNEYDIRFTGTALGSSDLRSNVSPKIRFTGLTPNTEYQVDIRGRNGDGTSPWSSALTVFTRPPKPEPPKLAGNDEQSRGPDFLSLAWKLVGTQYKYDLQLNSNSKQDQTSGDKVDSLDSDTVYEVRVRAKDATRSNVSFWSDPLKVITRPATPPSPFFPATDAFIPKAVIGWNIQAPSSSSVQLRISISSAAIVVSQSFKPEDQLTEENYEYGRERKYALKLIIPRSEAPGGKNESYWSEDTLFAPPVPLGLYEMIESAKYKALRMFN
jgi:chitodextrinase